MRTLIVTALIAVSSSAPMAQEIIQSNDRFVSQFTRAEVMAGVRGGEMLDAGEITRVPDAALATGRSRSDLSGEGRYASSTRALNSVYDVRYEN